MLAFFVRVLARVRKRRKAPTTFAKCLAVHCYYAAPRSALK